MELPWEAKVISSGGALKYYSKVDSEESCEVSSHNLLVYRMRTKYSQKATIRTSLEAEQMIGLYFRRRHKNSILYNASTHGSTHDFMQFCCLTLIGAGTGPRYNNRNTTQNVWEDMTITLTFLNYRSGSKSERSKCIRRVKSFPPAAHYYAWANSSGNEGCHERQLNIVVLQLHVESFT